MARGSLWKGQPFRPPAGGNGTIWAGASGPGGRRADARAQLVQALEAAGNDERALETYEQLLARSPEDETTRRQYMKLRAKAGLEPMAAEIPPLVKMGGPGN